MQDWKHEDELKVRVCSQKFFVLWPSDANGLDKKTSQLAIKLNKCLLRALVGRAELCPTVMLVDELQPLLEKLSSEWNVAWSVLDNLYKIFCFWVFFLFFFNPFTFGWTLIRLKFPRDAVEKMPTRSKH